MKKILITLISVLLISGCQKKISVDEFISQNKDNPDGLIIAALYTDNSEILNQLLERGYDADQEMHGGITPLMWAARTSNYRAVKTLLENGADPNRVSGEDLTPLEYACIEADEKCAGILIDAGANVNRVSKGDFTPLFTAVTQAGKQNFAEFLIRKGADINRQDNHGDTALIYAVYCSDYEQVKMLLKNGADRTITNKDGETALSIARNSNSPKLVKLLSE